MNVEPDGEWKAAMTGEELRIWQLLTHDERQKWLGWEPNVRLGLIRAAAEMSAFRQTIGLLSEDEQRRAVLEKLRADRDEALERLRSRGGTTQEVPE